MIGFISDKIGRKPFIVIGSIGLFMSGDSGLHADQQRHDRFDLRRPADAWPCC
jgi:hypothetical protein